MSEHKLQPGKLAIERLSSLGRGLGYFVQCEETIRSDMRTPPAIDVAWKKDEEQDFPLMIFEVESSAGNTIANNALKVFSQTNQDFEKPLFFFHLVMRAGKHTSRIDALRKQYGTSNYRVYRLDTKEATNLIQDIISQHRRLSLHLDVVLICCLLRDGWEGLDLGAILDHAESLHFDTTFLAEYARLSVIDGWFLNRFVGRLSKLEDAELLRCLSVKYETFLGVSWHAPIHLAMLARAKNESADLFLKRLRDWQEKSYPCTMIGPHFGMSRDYDQFILCISSGLWSSIAAIFGNADARRYIAEQMHVICEQLRGAQDRFALYAGVWLLHVSASVGDTGRFEYARSLVNDRGGISPRCVSDPPFLVPSFEDLDKCEWDELLLNEKTLVPPMEHFIEGTYRRVCDSVGDKAMRLGIGMLIEPEWSDWFGSSTVAILESERI